MKGMGFVRVRTYDKAHFYSCTICMEMFIGLEKGTKLLLNLSDIINKHVVYILILRK